MNNTRQITGDRINTVLEDVTWLANTGAGLHEAAHRVHTTPTALERFLERNRHLELLRTLRAQDQLSDAYLAGISGTHDTHSLPVGPARGHWKVA